MENLPNRNVLLIIPELGKGGAERAISKLSLLLAANFKVYFCVFHTESKSVFPFAGDLIDLNTPPTKSFLKKIYYIFLRLYLIRSYKKNFNIDHSISFLEGADYLNILTKYHEKVIISIRGSKQHDDEISGLMGLLRKRFLIPNLYKKADSIVTVSKALEFELNEHFYLNSAKIRTIPNFYDLDQIKRLSQEEVPYAFSYIYDTPVIINVGRLHPQKGQEALIVIFSELINFVRCRLVIIGDGQLKTKLISKAEFLGLTVSEGSTVSDADVYFLGYQANPFSFVSKAQVFAFPSFWEGFPNALLEALVCGVPVISSDCPTGPREILAPETPIDQYAEKPEETPYGWLMPLPKIDDEVTIRQWCDQLKIILANSSDNHAKIVAAKERVKHYSEENIGKLWMESLSEIK